MQKQKVDNQINLKKREGLRMRKLMVGIPSYLMKKEGNQIMLLLKRLKQEGKRKELMLKKKVDIQINSKEGPNWTVGSLRKE